MTLRIVPARRADVSAFVSAVHRHHRPSVGDVFRLACVDGSGTVRGVCSVGRPVARRLDDGMTLEITRVATDGARNACSLLYGAARRVAWGMGYARIFTYTLPEEGGASLRAAGWVCDGERSTSDGTGWATRAGRADDTPGRKTRWHCDNPKAHAGDVIWPVAEEDACDQVCLFSEAS